MDEKELRILAMDVIREQLRVTDTTDKDSLNYFAGFTDAVISFVDGIQGDLEQIKNERPQ